MALQFGIKGSKEDILLAIGQNPTVIIETHVLLAVPSADLELPKRSRFMRFNWRPHARLRLTAGLLLILQNSLIITGFRTRALTMLSQYIFFCDPLVFSTLFWDALFLPLVCELHAKANCQTFGAKTLCSDSPKRERGSLHTNTNHGLHTRACVYVRGRASVLCVRCAAAYFTSCCVQKWNFTLQLFIKIIINKCLGPIALGHYLWMAIRTHCTASRLTKRNVCGSRWSFCMS